MTKLTPNTVIRVPQLLNVDFFRIWLLFLTPFHTLTETEMNLMAHFLFQRWRLSNHINDDDLLDRNVMGEEIKREVRDAMGISASYYQVLMVSLRKKRVIVDGRIERKLIPTLKKEGRTYTAMLLFEFGEEEDNS